VHVPLRLLGHAQLVGCRRQRHVRRVEEERREAAPFPGRQVVTHVQRNRRAERVPGEPNIAGVGDIVIQEKLLDPLPSMSEAVAVVLRIEHDVTVEVEIARSSARICQHGTPECDDVAWSQMVAARALRGSVLEDGAVYEAAFAHCFEQAETAEALRPEGLLSVQSFYPCWFVPSPDRMSVERGGRRCTGGAPYPP
jgi:hypothetical protein